MAFKDKSLKEKVFSVLAFVWHRIVPLLLVLGFFVGVFFNLWKVQELNVFIAAAISTVLAAVGVFFMGLMIKAW